MIIFFVLLLIFFFFNKKIYNNQISDKKSVLKVQPIKLFIGTLKYRIFITYLNKIGKNLTIYLKTKQQESQKIKDNENKFPKDNGNFD
jgi:hypothetical protein